MSYENQRPMVLTVVFLVVLGLMALMAPGAQALWLESGAAIGANKLVEVAAHTEGLLDVESQNLIIHCANVAGDDILILSGTNLATGQLLFSTCKVLQNGTLSNACDKTVDAGGTVLGLLEPIVANFKAHIVTAEGKAQILFQPQVGGGNFAVVEFHETCALPLKNNVKGTLLVECLTGALVAADCLTERETQLLKVGSEAAHTLTYGTAAAKLLGITKAKLASGNNWCGHV